MLWLLVVVLMVFAVGLGVLLHRSVRRSEALLSASEEMSSHIATIQTSLTSAGRLIDNVLNMVEEGVLVLRSDLHIERSNRHAAQLLNLAIEEPAGRNLASVVVDADVLTAVRNAIAQGGVESLQMRRLGPGSGTVAVSVRPVDEGRWVVVVRDLAEKQRTEELRRDFVANVSHELRTPMASIKAVAETLRDGAYADPAVAVKFLEDIISEAERLTRIADDLLTLADAERKPPEKRPVELAEVCAGVVSKCQQQADRAGLVLTADLQPDVVIMGDRDQLEAVVVNLLDNAIKYTPSGGSVTISVGRDGGVATLQVVDTGIGIMAEDLPRIFERFYRVDKARSRASGGTGLGLSIVKHIVESHGGSVWAESVYTQGSTFTVRLPVAHTQPSELIPTETAARI